MKKIYKLTSTRIDNNDSYITEELYFSSKNKAIKSMESLRQYLIYNHTLNANNIEHYNNYKAIQTLIIDNTFNVSLIEHNIKTLTLKHI